MPKHTRASSSNQARASSSQTRYAQAMPVSVAAPAMPVYRPPLQLDTDYYHLASASSAEAALAGTVYDAYTPTVAVHSAAPQTAPEPRRLSSGAWSEEQDLKLIQLRKTAGNWAKIAEHFSGKTGNACRKRHERLLDRQKTSSRDEDTLQRVSKAYMGMRKEVWRELAKQTQLKWSDVENIVLDQGLKNLQNYARRPPAHAAAHHHYHGYDDDSGNSGAGLTPVDDRHLDVGPVSYDTSPGSSGGSSSHSYHGRAGGYGHTDQGQHYHHPVGGYHSTAPYPGSLYPGSQLPSSFDPPHSAVAAAAAYHQHPAATDYLGREMGIPSLINRR